MKKILIFSILAFVAASCSLEYFPSDSMSSSQIKEDAGSAVYATDGNYSMFKDQLDYNGTVMSGNSYIRHYFIMSEWRGDNALLSGRTEDPIYEALCYKDNSTLYNLTYMWYVAYKIIYGTNAMIENIPEGQDAATDHLKGENYFMRAIAHLHLSNLFSFPYTNGRDNLGVVLRKSTDCSETKRATVGEVYDQIVLDLKEAIRLMSGSSRRGNNGYIGKEAAQGLLTRVYLQMGMDDECIALVNEMLGSASPASKLDPDYENLFANSLNSPEVLWCVGLSSVDNPERSALGSMYYSSDAPGGTGWAEVYYTQPLMDLFNRYPGDLRFTTMSQPYFGVIPQGQTMIYWPIANDVDDFRSNWIDETPVMENGKWTCKDEKGAKHTVETELVNGYERHYIMQGTEKIYVTVSERIFNRQSFPGVFMKKFANQDNIPMLSSPIMLRWGEIILNRAEAYAHKGNIAGALADVNVIRTRAGLSGDALMTEENYKERGYDEIIDVVLDERRMELCFEGFRATDMFRNKKSLDRRFAGVQPWEVIDYTDSRIPYRIPFDEISVSGIPQN